MCALNIVDKDSSNRQQTFTAFVPMPISAGQLDATLAASVPTDRGCGKFAVSYYLLWRWQLTPFGARPSGPVSAFQRWCIKLCITMKAVNQRSVTPMTIAEQGQIMRGIALITQKHEFSSSKPGDQYCHHLTGQVRRAVAAFSLGKIQFPRTIQTGQHGCSLFTA
jgi:hypothetical protein